MRTFFKRKFYFTCARAIFTLVVTSCQMYDPSTTGSASKGGGIDANLRVVANLLPRDFRAAIITNGEVRLTWTDGSDIEKGFRVERSSDGGVTYSGSFQAGANVTSISDRTIVANATYRYRLWAYNDEGVSDYLFVTITTPGLPGLTPPVLLPLVALSSDQIKLTWNDTSTGESGFRIERSTGGGAFTEIARVNEYVTDYTDTNLTPDTDYRYRVCAFDSTQESSWSGELVEHTPALPFLRPTSLIASLVSQSTVRLQWVDNTNNEDGFRVERSLDGLAFALIATLPAGTVSYDNTGLALPQTYYYRVQAFNSSRTSPFSETVSIALAAPVSALVAPASLLALTSGPTRVNLTWTESNVGETGVQLERSTDGTSFAALATLAANSASYSDLTVSASTSYFYRVRVYDASGASGYSNVSSVTTPAAAVTVPAPSALTAQALSAYSISLAWDDNSTGESGFRVERRTPPGSFVQVGVLGSESESFVDTGLSPATSYVYRVRAYTGAVDSVYSNEFSVTTPVYEPPFPAPSGLTATVVSAREVNLAWSNTAAQATGFKVERAPDATGVFELVATLPLTTPSYTDVGTLGAMSYRYRVYGYNATSASPPTEVAVTTPSYESLPAEPLYLTDVMLTTSSLVLHWVDNSSIETGYIIYRAISSGSFSEIGRVAGNVTSFTDSGIASNTTYAYKIRSYNAAGASERYSDLLYATTPYNNNGVTSAGNFRAVATDSSVTFYWNDQSTGETANLLLRINPDNTTTTISLPPNTDTHVLTSGLYAGYHYHFYVAATNGSFQDGSNQVVVTGGAGFPAAPAPLTKPQVLTANVVSASQINLTWTENNTDETGYRVDRVLSGTSAWVTVATLGPNSVAYSDTGLAASTTYYYRVVSLRPPSPEALSTTIVATTLPATLNAATNVNIAPDNPSNIQVTWSDTNSIETGYLVERATDDGPYSQIGSLGANAVSFNDTTGAYGMTYKYRIVSVATGLTSVYSTPRTVSTPAPPLNKPTGFSVVGMAPQACNLRWTDTNSAETFYELQRSTDGGATWTVISTTLPANSTGYYDTAATSGITNYYRVRARGILGSTSAFSDLAGGAPP